MNAWNSQGDIAKRRAKGNGSIVAPRTKQLLKNGQILEMAEILKSQDSQRLRRL
jgi:hypothetical protein